MYTSNTLHLQLESLYYMFQQKLTSAQGREFNGKLTDTFTIVKQKHSTKSLRSSKTHTDIQNIKKGKAKPTLGKDKEMNNNSKTDSSKKSMNRKDGENANTGRINEKKRKKTDRESIDRPITGGVKKLKSAKLKKHKQSGVR